MIPSSLHIRSASPAWAWGMTLFVETSSLVISSLRAERSSGSALSFIVTGSNIYLFPLLFLAWLMPSLTCL